MKKPKQYRYIKETNIEFMATEGCIIIIKKNMIFLVGTNNRNKEAFYSSTSIDSVRICEKKVGHRGVCIYIMIVWSSRFCNANVNTISAYHHLYFALN